MLPRPFDDQLTLILSKLLIGIEDLDAIDGTVRGVSMFISSLILRVVTGPRFSYQRGIEAGELVEAFYQRLIRYYQHLGRTAEARATGERCRRVLAAALGTPPSAETLALIRTLRL